MAAASSRARDSHGSPTGRWRLLLAATIVVGLSAACGGGSPPTVAPADIGHVHDLVTDGDTLLVATHRGLLRLVDGSYRAIGHEIHDLMAMTRDRQGDLIAGGHPDMRVEEYRVDGAPSFLGLARSSDDGENWEIVGLLGEAEFHALVTTTAGGIVGADSTGAVWRLGSDDVGRPVGSVPFDILDLAISPEDSTSLVATSYDGEFAVSDDAGETWERRRDAPPIIEIEWTPRGLIGATSTGQLWASSEPTGPFERAGDAPGDVESLLVSEAGTWVATHDGQIYRRGDDESWSALVRMGN